MKKILLLGLFLSFTNLLLAQQQGSIDDNADFETGVVICQYDTLFFVKGCTELSCPTYTITSYESGTETIFSRADNQSENQFYVFSNYYWYTVEIVNINTDTVLGYVFAVPAIYPVLSNLESCNIAGKEANILLDYIIPDDWDNTYGSYEIDFGNGNNQSSSNVSYTSTFNPIYYEPGTYKVVVKNLFGANGSTDFAAPHYKDILFSLDCILTDTLEVEVRRPIEIRVDSACCIGQNLKIYSESQCTEPISAWQWTINGQIFTDSVVYYRIDTTYVDLDIELIVYDAEANQLETTNTNYQQQVKASNWYATNVTTGKSSSGANPSPENLGSACFGDTHRFKIYNTSPDAINLEYSITFINNESGNEQTLSAFTPNEISYQFLESGVYTLVFSAPVNLTTNMYIVDPTPPINADSETTVYIGQQVSLFSGIGYDNFSWDMGDGTEYSGYSIDHVYSQAGTYEVTLNTSLQNSDGSIACPGSSTITITVLNNSPIINFFVDCDGEQVTFNASSPNESLIGYYTWTINGQEYNDETVVLNISDSGPSFNVSLTSNDSYGSTPLTTTQYFQDVTVNFANPIIEGSLYSCGIQTYNYANYSTSYEDDNIEWEVEGGQIISESPQSVEIEWDNQGQQSLTLTLTQTTGDQNNDTCITTQTIDLTVCCSQTADFVLNDGDNFQDLINLNGGSNEIVNKTIIVNGTLSSSSNYIKASSCRFLMGPQSTIEIDAFLTNGYTFEANLNTTFEACTNTMWKGINVSDGRIRLRRCVVEDAIVAVNIESENLYTNSDDPISFDDNQYVRLVGNVFRNNAFHISIKGNINSSSVVAGNTFTSSENLKIPFQDREIAFVAISIQNSALINIGQTGQNANQIDKTDQGIYASNSNVFIRNNIISNLPGAYTAGVPLFLNAPIGTAIYLLSSTATIQNNRLIENLYGIDSHKASIKAKFNYLENNYTGIRLTDLNNTSAVINYNQFYNNLLGINTFATGGGNTKIKYNKFDVGYTAMSLNAAPLNGPPISNSAAASQVENNCIYDHTGAGIYVRGEVETKINRNYIYNMWGTGISLVEAYNSRVTKNAIYGQGSNVNASAGIHATFSALSIINNNLIKNFNRGMQFTEDNNFTKVRRNIFVNAQYGVYLFNDGLIGPQGGNTQASDNRWATDFGLQGRYYLFSDNSNGRYSPFYYRNYGNITYPYKSEKIGEAITATIMPAYFVANPNYTGGLGNNYAHLNVCNGPGAPGPGIGTVGVGVGPTPLVQYINSIFSQWSNDFSPRIFIKHQRILRWLRAEPYLLENRPDLQAFMQEAKLRPVYKVQRALELSALGKNQDAIDLMTLVPAQNDVLATDREVNTIYLSSNDMEHGVRGISIEDRVRLRELAYLCPFTHGTSVYLARSMARFFDTQWVNYRNECEQGTPWIGAKLAQQNSPTKLYPNPTSGDMFVESAKGHKVIVLDVLGRILHTQEIYPNNKNLINLNHIEQGNYILHIKDKEGYQIEAKSFVKIR